MADTDRIFIADRITKRRFRSGKAQYYVKWKGCPSSYNTWEPESNILDPGLILEFEARLADACLKGKRPGRKPKLLKLKVVDLKRKPHDNNDSIKQRWMEPIDDTSISNTNNNMDSNNNEERDSCDVLDLNNNLQTEQRGDKWKVPRKPKSLFLEQIIKDDHSNRNSDTPHSQDDRSHFGVYAKADSPLMGLVPSPNYGRNCEHDCAKDRSGEDVSSLDTAFDRNQTTAQHRENAQFDFNKTTSTLKDGNSVKLGKFALLRKYRSSLEESDPVTATDVTVEGVTVTVRESDRPQGFFGPTTPKPWAVY